MKLINLTKKVVGDGCLKLSEDGVYITNGHWLCRRDILKQGAELNSVEALKLAYPKCLDVKLVHDSSVAQVVPKFSDPMKVTVTHWIKTCAGANDAVLFVGGKDDAVQLWVSRRYVDAFKIDELVIETPNEWSCWSPGLVMKGDEWQVCVMPMRIPDQPGLR